MTRLILPSSSIRPALFCRRPAVSTSTTSTPLVWPCLMASKATEAGSAPSLSERTTSTPTRWPQVVSCSAAAARKVSAAPISTCLSWATSTRASLPQVVVLPVPLTPTIKMTAGAGSPLVPWVGSRLSERSMSGPTSSRSCWRRTCLAVAGSRLSSTFSCVRSLSISSVLTSRPRSAVSRLSSISSQSASERSPRERTAKTVRPKLPEPARRERRRCIRPGSDSGVSYWLAGSGSDSCGSVEALISGRVGAGGSCSRRRCRVRKPKPAPSTTTNAAMI